MIKTILFDVDDTLYPRSSSLFPMIRNKIIQYMIDYLGLSRPEAMTLRERYLKEYGTATRGLMINDHINVHEYLAYVHDVPVSEALQPDSELDAILGQINVEKCLFTNATRQHGINVVEALGITRRFTRVFGLEDFNYISKPDPRPYQVALATLGVPGAEVALLEDSPVNLEAGRAAGMTSILVGDAPYAGPTFDYHIARVHDVLAVARRLGVAT
ncbi:MAG: pyrimidine 5'-nucleotidase [Chloroflexi bacterium]|nr:pyrimidine 5'-nucleotidase [Chloroflexota bacterium]